MQKSLERQAGVQKAVVSLRDGSVEVTPKEDGAIDPAQLLKATYDSGVTVAEMNMTATGHVVRVAGGGLALRIEPNRAFEITPNDLSKQLEALADGPTEVTITGQLYTKKQGKVKGASPALKVLVTEIQGKG